MSSTTDPGQPVAPTDPTELLKSRQYLALLFLGALIGVPVAAAAYYFLKWVNLVQHWAFSSLPEGLGFHGEPAWWPLIPLALGGCLVALSIQYLPGNGGHRPTDGFKASGAIEPKDLYGILAASFATLALGVVLGPEMPLVAAGSGLGALAVRLIKRDAPAQATVVIAAAGSFAAISSILGSPLVAAFLLMEAAGLGGPMLGVVFMPGLLASGVGALMFIGLYRWTGYGTFTLAIPHIPAFKTPDGWEFLWALAIGVTAPVLFRGIRELTKAARSLLQHNMLLLLPVAGLAVAGCAIAFGETSGRSSAEVLFSGENSIAPLVQQAGTWTVRALVLLVIFKGIAYGVSLAGFRGGPTFPAMFIGAAGGIALSHLPGLPMVAGVGMGIGSMTVSALGLPLTAVLLASLFLQSDALTLMPLVIVSVVVSYVVIARLPSLDKAAEEKPAASET